MGNTFRVGDVVTLRNWREVGSDYNRSFHEGISGTVCALREDGERVGVRWESNVNGHTCDGNCSDGYGWYVYAKYLKFADLPSTISESDILEILAI